MRREDDFIFFKVGDEPDPQYVHKVLTAHFHYERLQTTRRWFVGLLAVLGASLWLFTMWPSLVPQRIHWLTMQLFCGALVVTVITGALEYRWYRLRVTLLRGHQSPDERPPTP
jgi:hypothetical protein